MCFCCFDADTEIKLSNGEIKKIKDIKPGDKVLGMDKKINTVKKVEKPITHFRSLYSINDTKPFTTAEHPFKTPQGWGSIKNNRSLFDADTWANYFEKFSKNCKKILPGTVLINDKQGKVKVETITEHKTWRNFFKRVYNLRLDGNNTFYANSYLVHNKGGGGPIGGIIRSVTKVFKKTINKIFDFIGDVIGFVLKPFGVPDIPDFSAETAASGVKLQKPGTNVGFPVIYGHRRVGSVPIFAETNGADNQDLYVCYAICEGEIEGIRNIKVDGNSIGNSGSTYAVSTGSNNTHSAGYPYDGDRFQFQVFHGTENQAQSSLLGGSKTWGTKNRTLPGLAYVACRFRWKASDQAEADRNPFGGGMPQLEFDVYGKKVFDLTTHSGGLDLANDYDALTKTYSTNPANCLLDYLMNSRYGAGYNKSFINADSFKTAATKFNQTVTYDTNTNSTGPSITCNGVIGTESEIINNVKKLLSGCRTMMPFVEGRYKLKVEDGGNPTDITSSTVSVAFDVTTDHIVSQVNLSGESKESKYNQVIVNYIDPDEEFTSQQEFFNTTGDLAIDENETLTGEFTFDTITNRGIAKDFARLIYQKSRAQRQIQFSATQELMNVEVGDVIRVTDTILNLDQQTFRVVAIALQTDSTVRIEAVEHDATIYPHVATAQKEIAPTLFLPNSYFHDVRTKPQNAAPENYNNGTTSQPPPQTYQTVAQVSKFVDNPVPLGFQFVDEDTAVFQNTNTNAQYYLNGAVHVMTNFGYQSFTENQTGQSIQAMQARIFVAPPKGNFFITKINVDYYEGNLMVHTQSHSLVRPAPVPAVIRPPNISIFPRPGPTPFQYSPLRIYLNPKYSYEVSVSGMLTTSTANRLVFGGTIPGFTAHTYTLNGVRRTDASIEGLVNNLNDNFNSIVTLFPNGSNFTRNSGSSVNLGGTP